MQRDIRAVLLMILSLVLGITSIVVGVLGQFTFLYTTVENGEEVWMIPPRPRLQVSYLVGTFLLIGIFVTLNSLRTTMRDASTFNLFLLLMNFIFGVITPALVIYFWIFIIQ